MRHFSSTQLHSSESSFDTVGVVGLGLMGHGICQVAASSNKHSSVIAFEKEQRFLDSGRTRIENSISKLCSKGKLEADEADRILNNITYTTDVRDLETADFCIEAVIENIDLKRDLYQELGNICKPECIFASNTSSLSITELANMSNRQEYFVGVHFFNPVQLMPLVEVINTDMTLPHVFESAFQWVHDIGKVPVKCGDTPGFIVNRLLVPNIVQAILLIERGDATIKDVDLSMKLGAGNPMGPLHLADYIGLDTLYYILLGWVEKYPDEPSFIMPDILKAKVEAGDLGRKSGKGFYHWKGDRRGDPVE